MSKKLALTPLTAALQRMTEDQKRTLREEYSIEPALTIEPKPKPIPKSDLLNFPTHDSQCLRCKNLHSRGGKTSEWCKRKQAECLQHVEKCWRFKLSL